MAVVDLMETRQDRFEEKENIIPADDLHLRPSSCTNSVKGINSVSLEPSYLV
jgi:hypothetical protein